MKVQDIFNFLNDRFPVETACDFDNVGILVGDPGSEVTKTAVALDCTAKTVDFAFENGCNLIITHHPVIFDPLKTVLSDSVVYRLIKCGISVISMHTNLDIGVGGVCDRLCEVLELKSIEKVNTKDGLTLNTAVINPPKNEEQLAEYIKSRLGSTVTFAGKCDKISRLLICSGSGGEYIDFVGDLGCDALITADVKHHQLIAAANNNTPIFDAGHFETENVVVKPLCFLLKNMFESTDFLPFDGKEIKHI